MSTPSPAASCPCEGGCHKDRDLAHGPCCESPLPPDRHRRDRIRRALCNIDGKGFMWGSDLMEPDEYGEQADLIIQEMAGISLTPEAVGNSCAHCGSVTHAFHDCAEFAVLTAFEEKSRQGRRIRATNDERMEAHNQGEHAFCGDECDAPDDELPLHPNDEPPVRPWARSVRRTDGTRTVHIPWIGADGREGGSIRVRHADVRALALMLCDDATRISDPSGDPETDEERADRLEVEQEHTAGIHGHCDVTCEEAFPSLALRNAILFRAIPGSATMLDELVRRATTGGKS